MALTEFFDFMLIVSMVGISGRQEVELGIVQFILSDPRLELRSISCDEACSFVNNV